MKTEENHIKVSFHLHNNNRNVPVVPWSQSRITDHLEIGGVGQVGRGQMVRQINTRVSTILVFWIK